MPLTPEQIKAIASRVATSVITSSKVSPAASPREKALHQSISALTKRIASGETNPYIPDYPEYMQELLAEKRAQLAKLLHMAPEERAKEEARYKRAMEEAAEIESEANEEGEPAEEEDEIEDKPVIPVSPTKPPKAEGTSPPESSKPIASPVTPDEVVAKQAKVIPAGESQPTEVTSTKPPIFKELTDVSYYDDFLKKPEYGESKGYSVAIVQMSPDEYIAASAKMQGTNISRQIDMAGQDRVDKYAAMMAAGTKFDMPYLDFKRKEQEGRARALAAKKLGYDKIPVLIATAYEKKEQEEPALTPQVMEFAQNMDMINPEYSFDGNRWHGYSDTKVKTTGLIKQLKKHNDTLFIRKETLEKVLFYSVENIKGQIVVTDRSYEEGIKQEQSDGPNIQSLAEWVKSGTSSEPPDSQCETKPVPLKEYFAVEFGPDEECRPCRMLPVASMYLGLLQQVGEGKEAKALEQVYEGGDILTIAEFMDNIKLRARGKLRQALEELDCFAESYEEEDETPKPAKVLKLAKKRYQLGVPIAPTDANRLLGLPAKKPLSWQEFQDYAERNKIKH